MTACAGAGWQADSLQTRADALLSRSDTIDGLIQSTQRELSNKRKDFEHYKTRAQTEMAISLQASVGFVEPESPFTSSSPPSRSTKVDRTALHACRKRAMRLICDSESRPITVRRGTDRRTGPLALSCSLHQARVLRRHVDFEQCSCCALSALTGPGN